MEIMNGGLQVSDELLGTFAPIVLYWVYSGIYVMLGSFENYRLHTKKDEDEKNLVPKKDVVIGVLLQQAVQAVVATILFADSILVKRPLDIYEDTWLEVDIIENLLAANIVRQSDRLPEVTANPHKLQKLPSSSSPTILRRNDGIRHVAILHAPLHAPQQVLVQTHPFPTSPSRCPVCFRSFVQPSIGGRTSRHGWWSFVFSHLGMSPRASIFFFSFATLKTVDDHCGLWLPGNLFQMFFKNNSAYHDIHHQLYGNKYNFSQPFFVMWDRILGTYMPYKVEERIEGGSSAPCKDCKDN
ncbi:hypothetical protein DH2020_003339 [Rehmannia glutinosa]|uniref:Fatty acid hydroxylase domain-containing protein n=1 Tax=Rehmannia glutinosa TaxID=99300 RepID=A0ABR0XLS6_REHGL